MSQIPATNDNPPVRVVPRRDQEGVDKVSTSYPDRLKSQDMRVVEEQRDLRTDLLHSRFTGKGSVVDFWI